MGEQASSVMLNAARHDRVFEGYKEHSAGLRVSTELVILDLLRKSHPDYHVTCTSPSGCDFKGYAQAGHATAIKDANNELFDSTRIYVSAGPRLEKNPGAIVEHVRFGRWKYTWNNKGFILYEIEIEQRPRSGMKVLFILSPRSEAVHGAESHAAADELLMAIGDWSAVLHDEIYIFDGGYWAKSRELWESVQGSSWDEVILNPEMKANLIQDVQGFFDNKDLYKKLAVPWKRGLILHGVPGNGKTISIKALISALNEREEPVPSLYVKSFDARNGNTNAIRAIFTMARSMAPCFLIFEDLDALVTDATRSYFLNEVDGLESNDGILMVGSTNHLELLDPAISKRPSRFDRKYHFKLPDEDERTAYCQFWRKKFEGDETMLDFPAEACNLIAKMTDGYSFAYLKELFVTSLLVIAQGGAADIEEADKPVMVRREDAVEQKAVPAKKEEDQEESSDDGEPAPRKRIAAEVEIPASLKDNVLLKMIRAHSKTLLEEMDNTLSAPKLYLGPPPPPPPPMGMPPPPNVRVPRGPPRIFR
ncbi:putative ATPase [Lachnellula suecica]|uniref:Putative ATPase n=1 Tax=Lachnellula suecica TaxID=602035 RepID=A0A8T9CQ05_9HELO|nr:putative ATPase [Lachnellula suecica]